LDDRWCDDTTAMVPIEQMGSSEPPWRMSAPASGTPGK
jgi:hypothetical protein